jgi:hypothetical protein
MHCNSVLPQSKYIMWLLNISGICCLYFLATVFLASGASFDKLRKRFNLYAIYQVRSLSSPQRRTYRRAHQYKNPSRLIFCFFFTCIEELETSDKKNLNKDFFPYFFIKKVGKNLRDGFYTLRFTPKA